MPQTVVSAYDAGTHNYCTRLAQEAKHVEVDLAVCGWEGQTEFRGETYQERNR